MASRQLAHFKIRLRYHDIIEMLKNNDCCGFWFLVLRIVPNIRCVLSKWDYFVKKENLILGLKIKTRTNKEEQKLI